MDKTLSLLKSIDFLAYKHTFFYKSKSSFKTVYGGFFSLILVVLLGALVLLLGKEPIEQSQAILASSFRMNKDSKILIKDLAPMLIITDILGRNLLNDPEFMQTFSLNVVSVQYTNVDGRDMPNYTFSGLKRCSKEMFSELYFETALTSIDVTEYLCIDHQVAGRGKLEDNFLLNKSGESNSRSLWLSVSMCLGQETENCLKSAEKYTDFYVALLLSSQYFDATNKIQPVQYKAHKSSTYVSTSFEYTEYLTLFNSVLVDDKGMLFEEKEEIKFISVLDTKNRIKPIGDKRVVFNAILDGSPLENLTNMRYTKIPEVLANINAILKVFGIFFRFLSFLIGKFMFYKSFSKNILSKVDKRTETVIRMSSSSSEIRSRIGRVKTDKTKQFPNIFEFWCPFLFKKKVVKVDVKREVEEALSLEKIVSRFSKNDNAT